jgi:hypothetical protein
MDDNKLIAQALLEISQRSETTFLEVGKEDKELIEAAKKIGIELPSPDLMVMKTVYAEIDKVNLNGVILPKKAVEKGLPTLIGKQCNWEHNGSGFVCGYTISAKINGDKIETINVLFKSLFPDQAEELKEKVKSGEAAVSFEIWNKDPETKKSVVKELDDGNREINPIIFHGTGILLANKPACPKAKIFKLVAKKEINEAEKIIDKVFEQDLVYAQMAIEEPKCTNCGNCNCEKGGIDKIMLEELYAKITKEEDITFDIAMAFYYASEEEQKKLTEDAAKWTRKFINSLPDSAFAAIEPAYPEKVEDKNCRHLPHHNGEGDLGKDKSNANLDLPHYKNALARCNQIKPVSDSISADDLQKKASAHLERHKDALEKSSEEPKIEDKPTTETKPIEGVETKVEGNTPIVETKEVNAQAPLEVIEPKIIVKVTRIYSDLYVDTYVDGTPSGTSEGKSSYKTITEYKDGTQDVVEGESEYKKKYTYAELEEAVNKAKEELANLHKVELEAKSNEKIELEKKITEKETEIARLTQELETKTQELAKATVAPKEPEKPKEELKLEVGNTEDNNLNPYKERQKKINMKAYGHE